MLTPSSYQEALSKFEKQVSDKIKSYLNHPSEDNVHELRSSIRQTLATSNLLPKKIRKSNETKKYLDGLEKLLKLNAKVRDTDIVLSKLPNHGDSPEFSEFAKKLKNRRESSLKKAERFASSFKDNKGIALDAKDISPSALQKRFAKTANGLAEKLKQGLRIVKTKPKDLVQLHKLRENSRRLRYTLEIDNQPKSSKLVRIVDAWHDVLGKIRDADIFISSLEDRKSTPKTMEVLEIERKGRKANYEKFLEISRESQGLKYSRSNSEFSPD